MPTTIVFAAPRGDDAVTVTVTEDADAVYAAWKQAGGSRSR